MCIRDRYSGPRQSGPQGRQEGPHLRYKAPPQSLLARRKSGAAGAERLRGPRATPGRPSEGPRRGHG
eukprot:9833368-Lingulodinium_polyedra.AAC.1